jgi:hypothetical protein
MEKVFLIRISIKLDSNSSILIKFYLLLRSSRLRSKRRLMETRAKRTDSNKSRIIDFKPRKMLRPRKVLLEHLLNSLSYRTRKSMNSIQSGETNSRRSLLEQYRSLATQASTSTRELSDKMLGYEYISIKK